MERTTTKRIARGLVRLALLLTCIDATDITTTAAPTTVVLTVATTAGPTTTKLTTLAPDDKKTTPAAALPSTVAHTTAQVSTITQAPAPSAGQNSGTPSSSSDGGGSSSSGCSSSDCGSSDDSSNGGGGSDDSSVYKAVTTTVATTTVNMLPPSTVRMSTTPKAPEHTSSKGLPTTTASSLGHTVTTHDVKAVTTSGSKDGAGGVTENDTITAKMTTTVLAAVVPSNAESSGSSVTASTSTSTSTGTSTGATTATGVVVQTGTTLPQSHTATTSPTTVNRVTDANVAIMTDTTTTARTTETHTKTFTLTLNQGLEKDGEKELVAVCRRLLENMYDGTCTLVWRRHNGEILFNSAKIDGQVKESIVSQYYKEITKQHLTEELHTVENGYHDNPTLEVMEVQPEMQEKKMPLNGEFSNDGWIVPIDNLLKEDIPDEEDTHL
ncbi:podocalyxin isoform X2 [Lampris incognitus]|uniref:podocalyxin isoform X2 n=1 Tax=Lampris incognitus TaxID=2546036 RepID=UPI0024B55313|nr:podocalyxin isoform X2 [Lampris incognitus]